MRAAQLSQNSCTWLTRTWRYLCYTLSAVAFMGAAPFVQAEGTLTYFIKTHQAEDPDVRLKIVTFHTVEPDPRRSDTSLNPDDHREVRVDIEYPMVMGMSNRVLSRKINGLVHDWLFSSYERKALGAADVDVLVDAVIEGQVLSIIADKERLAHTEMLPETGLEARHFDLSCGRQIIFRELFNEDYHPRLKQVLTRGTHGLRQQQMEIMAANVTDSQSFYIENGMLFIYTGEASSDFSPEWVRIKLSELKGVLNEQHPMVRNAYVTHHWVLDDE